MSSHHSHYFFFLKTLRIAYNNSLRKLLGIPKYNSASEMFVCLNIPSLMSFLESMCIPSETE